MRDEAATKLESPSGRARRIPSTLFVLFAVVPLVTVAIASTLLFQPAGRVLEIEMRATGGNVAQIFWSDTYALNGHDSGLALLHQHPGDIERIRFPLPAKPLEVIRFDPLDGAGEVTVRSMRVVDPQGRTVRTIDPLVMMPLYQIAQVTRVPDGVRIVTTPGANDPMLVMRSSWLADPRRWYGVQFVTSISLAWIASAVVAILALSLALVARDVVRGPVALRHVLWFVALFLTVIWANAALLHRYPVPVPFWDQWDGEAATLYVPLPYDGVTWRQMFTLHNEHRIFFSRLLSLSLLRVNGQWDPHLQILVNAALHAFGAVTCAALLWLALDRRALPIVALGVGLAFAAPFALENSLSGFQSAFYFLILFSLLAFWLMGTHSLGRVCWWMGVLCAFCCVFTVAGGVLVIVPIGCVAVLNAIGQRGEWRAMCTNLLVLAAVVGLGYAALPPPIPYHEQLKAASVQAFAVSLGRNLAFPWIGTAVLGPIVWLPTVALLALVLRRRFRTTGLERVIIGLGLWVVVQALVIAYSRGATGISPTSRYLDTLAFGFVVNTMAMAALMALTRVGRGKRIAAAGAVTIWLVAGTIGIARLSDEMLDSTARIRRQWTREHLKNVRHFVRSNDIAAFVNLRGPRDVPYYSPAMLAAWLQHPYIRHILPAAIRAPIEIRPREISDRALLRQPSTGVAEVQPIFDSSARDRAAGRGRFVSEPISCHDFRHVRFEVASSASWSGLRLSIQDVRSGQETKLRPIGGQGGWAGISVRCPTGPFNVIAVDDSPTNWLAFREPAEIGWASANADWLIQRSSMLGLMAGALALVALMMSVNQGSAIAIAEDLQAAHPPNVGVTPS